jgi:hypothetical protein
MLFPLRLALRRDTYGRDDFSPNGRHSAIVDPGLRWVNGVVPTANQPLAVYPDDRHMGDAPTLRDDKSLQTDSPDSTGRIGSILLTTLWTPGFFVAKNACAQKRIL